MRGQGPNNQRGPDAAVTEQNQLVQDDDENFSLQKTRHFLVIINYPSSSMQARILGERLSTWSSNNVLVVCIEVKMLEKHVDEK